MIFDKLNEYKDIIALGLSTIAGTIGFATYRRNKKTSYGKERLESVVSPIFEIVERYLLRGSYNLSEEDCASIRDIVVKNPLIAGGKYRQYRFLKPHKRYEFKKLCKIVGSDYDRLCRIYSIPLRSLNYRIQNYSKSYAYYSAMRWIYAKLAPQLTFLLFILFSFGVLIFALWQLDIATKMPRNP